MTIPPLPKILHPIKFTNQDVSFSGEIALSQLPRVMAMPVSEAQVVPVVSANISFSKDEQNLRVVSGSLQCKLLVECQRCLLPMEQLVESDFQLGVVLTDEQANHLPKYYEPLLVENDEVNLCQLVEDELLLSMPMFSYHSDENCSEWKYSDSERLLGESGNELNTPVTEKENPFEILRQLKK